MLIDGAEREREGFTDLRRAPSLNQSFEPFFIHISTPQWARASPLAVLDKLQRSHPEAMKPRSRQTPPAAVNWREMMSARRCPWQSTSRIPFPPLHQTNRV